jgi:hypothetical protein
MTTNSVNTQRLYNSQQHPLTKFVKSFSAYEPADLLATVAGLQLMPENADRSVRLEFIAYAAASISLLLFCYFCFLVKLVKRVMLERILPASLRFLSLFFASLRTCFITVSLSLQVI